MELKQINMIIGPQASGKSVTVKLLYFFKSFYKEIIKGILLGISKSELDTQQKERFKQYFPKNAWPKGGFSIEYIVNESFISIRNVKKKKVSSLQFYYSDDISNAIGSSTKFYKDNNLSTSPTTFIADFVLKFDGYVKNVFKNNISEHFANWQLFIPAGRSFYANIQSGIFAYLNSGLPLDPFLVEFGSFYENCKESVSKNAEEKTDGEDSNVNKLISAILNGAYLREKEKDYLIHSDSRKVNIPNASSGQQEVLPLVIVLKALQGLVLPDNGTTLYIEEPEAHLFPVSQKRIVQLLARAYNQLGRTLQIIITTHSPYILSSFNNLMEAGKILDEKTGMEQELAEIIPAGETIAPDNVAAYALVNGIKTDLIDPSTRLISQNILDSVSDEISIEFGKLLDLEF